MKHTNLISLTIDTPIGEMIAICNDHHLYLLAFTDYKGLKTEIEHLKYKLGIDAITTGATVISSLIKEEIADYFIGKLKSFKTPLWLIGSDFQKNTWATLSQIPYGATISYKAQAGLMNQPNAYRATANANATNKLAIIVPCHRVISATGNHGGYKYGHERKTWLILHEESNAAKSANL